MAISTTSLMNEIAVKVKIRVHAANMKLGELNLKLKGLNLKLEG